MGVWGCFAQKGDSLEQLSGDVPAVMMMMVVAIVQLCAECLVCVGSI